MRKLSELIDGTLVASENSGVITAYELRNQVEEGEALNETYHTIQIMRWAPDAKEMISDYIERESQSMYEDWDDVAMDHVTDEVVSELQAVLDKALKYDDVRNYYTFKDKIVIDVLEVLG